MILVANNTPHSELPIVTDLQAIAVRVSLHRPVSLCSIYLPPNSPINIKDLQDLVAQLPPPVVLMGDFNAHSPVWGCLDLNNRGKIVEDFINHANLTLLNNKSNTYVYPATGQQSSLDLTICDPTLHLDLQWSVYDETCGSDHYPIIVKNIIPSAEPTIQSWKLDKADWETFRELCLIRLPEHKILDEANPIGEFTDILYEIASSTVPQTKQKAKHPPKPWFNDNCKDAIKKRKESLQKLNSRPTRQHLESFRINRAKARRVIRQEKRNSWHQYVSELNSRANVKKAWDMVRKISGKNISPAIKHLSINGSLVTDKKEIADAIAANTEINSSNNHYSAAFQQHKIRAESTAVDFRSRGNEYYNSAFSNDELIDVVQSLTDSSTGPDNIHNRFIKYLPEETLQLLLKIFNNLWEGGTIPPIWQQAIVVPIPKPDKDHSDPNNYRPISLTSCLCKTFEKLVNNRLVYYLESNNLLTDTQSGFRKQRCTTDHLVRLETWVREGLINREHVVAISFDLEKAYDTTWRHGILLDLYNIGLRGNLPKFIVKFLANRSFRVRVGTAMSETHTLENGVPQGSILSVTLFGIKINSITSCINPAIDNSLFVDDFQIVCRSKSMRTIERKLQLCLNNLENWTNCNGFKFSTTKTVCVHFCNQRRQHDHPQLTLLGNQIPVEPQTKFLGIIFDSKLSFIPHLKQLRTKCTKAINLLKVVAAKQWGSDTNMLLRLYRSLIRPKLDYGCIVYGSARKSYVQMLDPIQNQALRISLGAFRTSPIDSLEVEANETPLSVRRQKLAVQYFLKIKSNPLHPVTQCVTNQLHKNLFDLRTNTIAPFGIRMERLMSSMDLSTEYIAENMLPEIPPFNLLRPSVDFSLHNVSKKTENPLFHLMQYREFIQDKRNFTFLFTDGSKDASGVSSAVVDSNNTLSCRLPNESSVFSAEAQAIILALKLIETSSDNQYYIFSDSLSNMQAISHMKLTNPLILKILETYNDLCRQGKQIKFCWVPSHVGIKGNEAADAAATNGHNQPIDNTIRIPYSDLKCRVRQYYLDLLQSKWNNTQFNKLRTIKETLGRTSFKNITLRRDEIVLHRLRIGHTKLTHSYLLNKEDAPECPQCFCLLTVEHLLIQCPTYNTIRKRFYNIDNMKDLFLKTQYIKIIEFLKEIQLYSKI